VKQTAPECSEVAVKQIFPVGARKRERENLSRHKVCGSIALREFSGKYELEQFFVYDLRWLIEADPEEQDATLALVIPLTSDGIG
jgi:hypothetical protein